MRHRLALGLGSVPGFAQETAEKRSAGRMPEPFGLEPLPQWQGWQGPSSYQPCRSATLALSTLVFVEVAVVWALWEWANNSREMVAVPRTLWVVACTSAQMSLVALQLGLESYEPEPRKIWR